MNWDLLVFTSKKASPSIKTSLSNWLIKLTGYFKDVPEFK